MDVDADNFAAVEDATELLLEGETQSAIEALREVLRINPKNSYGFFYLATALYELERLDASRDAFRAAATLSPGYLGAWVGLSHVLRQLGEHNEALEAANEALKRAADDGDALYAAAMAHASLGERAKARRLLEKYLNSGI